MTTLKRLREILAQHAEEIQKGKERGEAEQYPDLSPDEEAELVALLDLAERVQTTLRPVTPSRNFETDLKQELLTTAHLRNAEGYVPPNPARDLMILVAIIGFLISLATLLVVMRRYL